MPATETNQTIHSLFSTDTQFAVPSYQRAYSWEEKHLKLFLKDLREQPDDCPYYLGHFIFEKDPAHAETYLIDGQQRMTTVTLFIASVCSILKQRAMLEEKNTLIKHYLNNELGLRFKTVKDDIDLFEELILDSQFRSNSDTNSKKRLVFAENYLRKHLIKEETSTLLGWVKIVKNADITTFTVNDKIQATQIFTLQNSRGKDLTELEKLKAYLMYQIYLNDEKIRANRSISSIEKQFEIIYRECENTSFKEDEILRYHDRAYSPHWETPTKNVEHQIEGIVNGSLRVTFIKEFCKQLAKTFQDVIALEKLISHNPYIADPIILDPANAWPFLIKFYNTFGPQIATDRNLCQILRMVEITLMKFEFQHKRSHNHLISIAKNLDSKDDIEGLMQRLTHCSQHSFGNRGDFNERFISYLNGDYHYHRITRYMLWKFENAMRHGKEAKVSPREYRNEVEAKKMDATIEHIAPREPQQDIYTQEFIDTYLNNLGNLLYIPKGLNSSLNNKPPMEKAVILEGVSLATSKSVVKEIQRNSDCNCTSEWCPCKIKKRKSEIIKFALKRWKVIPEKQ